MDDLVQDAGRVAPPFGKRFDDTATPLRRDRLDERLTEPFRVRLGGGDVHRPMREAVPEGVLAAKRLLVQLCQHPAQRTRIAQSAVVPAHRLRERETADDGLDPLRKDVPDRPAGLLDPEKAVTHL